MRASSVIVAILVASLFGCRAIADDPKVNAPVSPGDVRPEVRFEYHDSDFTWDKRELDTPPILVGGQAALTRYLDYPRELRRRRIEGKSIASVTVDRAGRVTRITFTPPMNGELQQITRSAVLRCQLEARI